MPHGGTSTFYDAQVIEKGKVRTEPRYLTDLWTSHGVRFIEQNKNRPFFLFLSYNGPYGLGRSLSRPARNRHAAYYADKQLPSFPRGPMHPWLHNNKEYINNLHAIRRYACELSAIDDGVGEILHALKKLALDAETLVIFTADQGWAGGHHGIWVLSYLDLSDEVPNDPTLPGRDYSAALKAKKLEWDNVVFYEFENVRAVRTVKWKYVERYPDGPHELYDLKNDPGERFNLYGQPKQGDIQKELRARLYEFFSRYADPEYDLWRGGRSKTHLLSAGGESKS